MKCVARLLGLPRALQARQTMKRRGVNCSARTLDTIRDFAPLLLSRRQQLGLPA